MRQAVQLPGPSAAVGGPAPLGSDGPTIAEWVVVGIDPSLAHTGVCVSVNGVITAEHLLETTPDILRPARLIRQRDAMRYVLEHLPACQTLLVAMESEIYSANQTISSEQAAIQATYQMLLWEWAPLPSFTFLSVNVAHVKKYAGAQKKDQILLQVYKRWKREYADDNAADAFVIAAIANDFYAYHMRGKDPAVTVPQQEVLDKLVKAGLVWEPETRVQRARERAALRDAKKARRRARN